MPSDHTTEEQKCENCRGMGRVYDQTWSEDRSWLCLHCDGTGLKREVRRD